MGTALVLNGVSYTIPAVGEDNWGTDVGNYLVALATGTLTKAGGAFTLTADADFGANFGLKSKYFKSRGTVAASGIMRLANLEAVSWRDAGNTSDLALTVSAANWLQYRAVDLLDVSSGQTITGKTFDASANTVSNIVNANIGAAAAIAYSKLALSGSIVNADINASAAIAYSKLALSGSIATGDLAAALLVPIGKGGTGQITAAAAFKALAGYSAKGQLPGYDGSAAGLLSVGADGLVLTADAASTYGLKWAAALTNPMVAAGDMIYGGAAGVATKLATGATTGVLHGGNGATPSWSQIVNADVSSSAAIAYSKLALTASIVDADVSASAAIAGSKIAAATSTTAGTVPKLEQGSFTSSASGPFTAGNVTVNYTKVGNQVTLSFASRRLAGNSAASTISFDLTNMPATLRPVRQNFFVCVAVTDAGSDQAGAGMIYVDTSGTSVLYKNGTGASFTATASTVGFYSFSLTYETA